MRHEEIIKTEDNPLCGMVKKQRNAKGCGMPAAHRSDRIFYTCAAMKKSLKFSRASV